MQVNLLLIYICLVSRYVHYFGDLLEKKLKIRNR